jgi:hypothetical protein
MCICCGFEKEESSSFLKKRTKKLLTVAASGRANTADGAPRARDQSSLVLFFKKVLLFSV